MVRIRFPTCIGRKYEHVELSKKIWAIDKLPVIPLPDKLADAA